MFTPVDVRQSVASGTDKVVHLAACRLLVLPAALWRRVTLGLLFIWLFVGAAAFGGAVELIQPYFSCIADVNDWVADMAGAALGLLLALGIRRIS